MSYTIIEKFINPIKIKQDILQRHVAELETRVSQLEARTEEIPRVPLPLPTLTP